MGWVDSFFDTEYLRIWGAVVTPERSAAEVADIWKLVELREGARVLDAPCGYGRIARRLAERGADVLGVDLSAAMIAEAERERGAVPAERLRYRRHDLREPIGETDFDCALNIFSSLGYTTEEDDCTILANLCAAVKPGGFVVVDFNHRDLLVAKMSRGVRPAGRHSDGTLVLEVARFDPVQGRAATTWFYSGPNGAGQKSAHVRSYTITEMVRLGERAGLALRSVHKGLTAEPFTGEGPDAGGRAGIVFTRPR